MDRLRHERPGGGDHRGSSTRSPTPHGQPAEAGGPPSGGAEIRIPDATLEGPEKEGHPDLSAPPVSFGVYCNIIQKISCIRGGKKRFLIFLYSSIIDWAKNLTSGLKQK